MKRTYDLGRDKNQIFIEISVGTPGIAYTSVSQFHSGGQPVKLAESTKENGNVAVIQIGNAPALRTGTLRVQTTIDFDGLDQDEWEQLRDTIAIFYIVSGGFSGKQIFYHDSDDMIVSQNGKIVIVIKLIELN